MKSLFKFILLLTVVSCSAQEGTNSNNGEVIFSSVNVIPMDNETVLKNQDVVIKNGKIASISEAGKTKRSKDATVIDGKGKYLLPGLAEMHAHVPPNNDVEQMKEV